MSENPISNERLLLALTKAFVISIRSLKKTASADSEQFNQFVKHELDCLPIDEYDPEVAKLLASLLDGVCEEHPVSVHHRSHLSVVRSDKENDS